MKNNFKYIIAWCLYAIFLFIVFNIIVDFKTALTRTAVMITFQIFIFYSNLKWILPRFYDHKKYVRYAFINLIMIVLSVWFNSFIEKFTPHYIKHSTEEHYLEMTHFNMEIIFINVIPILLIVFISFFLHTSEKQQQQEKRALALATAEKQFLVQQINPHFLFNALNNIYFLTYKTAPKGSTAIMQLSKMLDYSLYGEKQDRVSLKDEIAYITNFIELFKLKDSELTNIKFDYSKTDTTKNIAPLLLIPFVENAFKHGDIEDTDKGFISIELSTNDTEIVFTCINSYNPAKSVDSTKGIGVKNVSRRLDLLYPENHKLDFNKAENRFSVSLKINTNA